MTQQQQNDRVALLIPGAQYGIDRPLLDYARLAVKRRGSTAYELNWAVPEQDGIGDHRGWVCDQVAAALDRLGACAAAGAAGSFPLIIGKSMASLGAKVIADRKLPAIWLTPLLHDHETVSALQAAAAPTLLIGGTADPAWNGEIARSIGINPVKWLPNPRLAQPRTEHLNAHEPTGARHIGYMHGPPGNWIG